MCAEWCSFSVWVQFTVERFSTRVQFRNLELLHVQSRIIRNNEQTNERTNECSSLCTHTFRLQTNLCKLFINIRHVCVCVGALIRLCKQVYMHVLTISHWNFRHPNENGNEFSHFSLFSLTLFLSISRNFLRMCLMFFWIENMCFMNIP